MRLFHISDVLSVTTGRLVSNRHMDGIYDILNFLTGDNLFTHQLPRAWRECQPWLRAQFPQLMEDSPEMAELLADLSGRVERGEHECEWFVSEVQQKFGLPEMIPVYEMSEDMHTYIDPLEEARAMVGDDRVITGIVEGKES